MITQLQDAVAQIEALPVHDQEEAANFLATFATSRAQATYLSDDQLAEVKRRIANPDPKNYSLEEVEKHLNDLLRV